MTSWWMRRFSPLVYKTHKGVTFQAFIPLFLCNLPCQQASNWTIVSGKTQDTPNKESTRDYRLDAAGQGKQRCSVVSPLFLDE